MRISRRSLEQRECGELVAQLPRRTEMDAVHPERGCGGGIRRVVIDEHRVRRRDRVAFEQDAKDPWIRLDYALLARHDDAIERRQEEKPLALRRKRLGRKIRKRVNGDAGARKLEQYFDGAVDCGGNHLVEPRPKRLDQMRLVGMRRDEFADGFGELSAPILPLVPFLRANGREEIFHRLLVAGKQLAVEEARIPLQQHAAQVEYDDAAGASNGKGRCHWIEYALRPRV